jgi:ubiquitin-activating enzyme E1
VFCDFGEKFVAQHPYGERIAQGKVDNIDPDGCVHISASQGIIKGSLCDGDVVVFREVQGVTGINGVEFLVSRCTRASFYISLEGISIGARDQVRGGVWEEVRKPVTSHFRSWQDSLHAAPSLHNVVLSSAALSNCRDTYFLALLALQRYGELHGRPHKAGDEREVEAICSLAEELNTKFAQKIDPIDLELIRRIGRQACGHVAPIASIIGGVAAHEVVKSTGYAGTPLHQWLFFDALECLPQARPNADAVRRCDTRYDGQIAVFGRDVNANFLDANYLLDGAGAIGGEMLKNWALMGVGAGSEGMVYVADKNTVQLPHIRSSVLFRHTDVKVRLMLHSCFFYLLLFFPLFLFMFLFLFRLCRQVPARN